MAIKMLDPEQLQKSLTARVIDYYVKKQTSYFNITKFYF